MLHRCLRNRVRFEDILGADRPPALTAHQMRKLALEAGLRFPNYEVVVTADHEDPGLKFAIHLPTNVIHIQINREDPHLERTPLLWQCIRRTICYRALIAEFTDQLIALSFHDVAPTA